MIEGTMRMRSLYSKLPTHSKETVDSKKHTSSIFPTDRSETAYYTKYLKGLEDFLHKESLSLTTREYYRIFEEIESIKLYIKKLDKL